MSLTHDLASAVHPLRCDALAERDLTAVRSLFLDFIGVAANGSRTDSAETYRAALDRLPEPNESPLAVIGTGRSRFAVPAAMANAVAAHSIEYDDVHNSASLHPGVVIFPTALAASVLTPTSDEDFIRGVVIGYEVMCRVGSAANPPAHYARHFHPTGTAGAIGAAAAAAAVSGLSAEAMVAAMGIAATMASGSMSFLADGAWTKRLNPALAVRAGLEAATLAASSFLAPLDGIAGEQGFLAAYSDQPDYQLLLKGWGDDPLAVTATSVKAHTCCRYCQGPIDAVIELRNRAGLAVDEVESIVIGLPTAAVGIVAEPYTAKQHPRTVVDAQFSLQFGVAVALKFGHAGLEQFAPACIDDPEIQALMQRVDYQVDADIDRDYPAQWRAWAQINTTDGRTLTARVDEPKGDPGNPLTPLELVDKFRALTADSYSSDRQGRIELLVGGLGTAPTLGELLTELAAS